MHQSKLAEHLVYIVWRTICISETKQHENLQAFITKNDNTHSDRR